MMKQKAIDDLYSSQNDLVVRRSDREARRVSSIVVASWDNLLTWIRAADIPTYQYAWKHARALVAGMFERLYQFVEVDLYDVAQWGWLSAMDTFYEAIGQDGVDVLQEATGFRKPNHSPTREKIMEILHATVNGLSARGRLVSLFQIATQRNRLIDKIAAGISAGARLLDIKTTIQPILNKVKYSAERLVRTEVRRISHAMHGLVWSRAGRIVEGFVRRSQRDARVRPSHVVRDGLYFAFSAWRPSLPDDPNCRCFYVPVLRRPAFVI